MSCPLKWTALSPTMAVPSTLSNEAQIKSTIVWGALPATSAGRKPLTLRPSVATRTAVGCVDSFVAHVCSIAMERISVSHYETIAGCVHRAGRSVIVAFVCQSEASHPLASWSTWQGRQATIMFTSIWTRTIMTTDHDLTAPLLWVWHSV